MKSEKLAVLASFVDEETGAKVNPGDPLPKLSDERLARLQRARCVGPLPTGQTVSKPAVEAGETFPGGSPDVAGGDGGDTGGRTEPAGKRTRGASRKR